MRRAVLASVALHAFVFGSAYVLTLEPRELPDAASDAIEVELIALEGPEITEASEVPTEATVMLRAAGVNSIGAEEAETVEETLPDEVEPVEVAEPETLETESPPMQVAALEADVSVLEEAQPVAMPTVQTAEPMETQAAEAATPSAEAVEAVTTPVQAASVAPIEPQVSAEVMSATGVTATAAILPDLMSETAAAVVQSIEPIEDPPAEAEQSEGAEAEATEVEPTEPVQDIVEVEADAIENVAVTAAQPLARAAPVQPTQAAVEPVTAEAVTAEPIEAAMLEPAVEEATDVAPQPKPRIKREEPEPEPKAEDAPKKEEPEPKKEAPKKEPEQKRAEAEPKKDTPKKEATETQPPKKRASQGSGGQDTADSQASTSKGSDGKGKKPGGVSASKYPSLVQARVRKALRVPANAKGKRGEVQVQFVVSASGSVSGISVVKSSGVAALDDAAVAAVKRAAPFPPIPEDAGQKQLDIHPAADVQEIDEEPDERDQEGRAARGGR